MNFRFSPSARLAEESHVSLVRDISLTLNMTEWWGLFWIASKSKIFRNDKLNLQISQITYSHLMKQRKNSCCLSDSEFTSLGLNLVTVFGRRCFSFLSNVYFYSWQIKDLKRSHRSVVLLVLLNASRHRQHRLTLFLAIKKKEYLVRGLERYKSQVYIVIQRA